MKFFNSFDEFYEKFLVSDFNGFRPAYNYILFGTKITKSVIKDLVGDDINFHNNKEYISISYKKNKAYILTEEIYEVETMTDYSKPTKEVWTIYKYNTENDKYIPQPGLFSNKEKAVDELETIEGKDQKNIDYYDLLFNTGNIFSFQAPSHVIYYFDLFESMEEFLETCSIDMWVKNFYEKAQYIIKSINLFGDTTGCLKYENTYILMNDRKYICIDWGEPAYILEEEVKDKVWGIYIRQHEDINEQINSESAYKGYEVFASKKEAIQSLHCEGQEKEPDYIIY